MSGLHALSGSESFDPNGGPVALFLHGYGSHEQDLASLARWLPDGTAWASLRAPIALPHGGNAWFPITTPGNPAAEPVAAGTDAIWSWVDEHIGSHATVIPIGFSQGGLMATQLLRTRPDQVIGAVVLGGFVQAADQSGDDILAARRPPVFWGRGADDHVITADALLRTRKWLPAHSTLTERVYAGLAHGIDASEMDDVRAFLTMSVADDGSFAH
jgi:phospholipase/carboxylesterase